jgi:tRNA-2-methylthio-N6-dimethylallyladenosine synthase
MDELIKITSREKSAQGRADETTEEKLGVYIKTFGCQMNVYDTEKLYKILEGNYQSVDNPENANLVLINTCSVRDKPEQKLYSLLGELKHLKDENPNLMVGVGGCVAQQEGQNIVKKSKVVDFVFGTHNLSLVPSLIERRKSGQPPQVAIDYRDEWEELPLGLTGQGRVSAFVSISRGCNKNCAYCIVPTTRGPEVSRALSEIEKEIRILAHRGAKEVILLGQTVNSYGLDLTPRMKFSELLQKVSLIDGIQRIRFTSPHPQEVRQDFYDLIKDNPKVCRHIHMPLQAGSDHVLKLMNRNYRKKRYLDIIQGLKEAAPDISITTDIIVGFPGETEEDFLETLEVMKIVEFDSSYSFAFSPRPGTKAETMSDQVPVPERFERLQRLQALQNEITEKRLKAWVGKEAEILIDGPSKEDPKKLQGRNSQNILVNLLEYTPELEPGDIVNVLIDSAARYTLKGVPVQALKVA